MANLDKFLNKAGVSTLWGQIAAEVAKVDVKADANAKEIATLKTSVEALQKGTYDDTAVRKLITANDTAIKANAAAITTFILFPFSRLIRMLPFAY